MNSLQKLVKYCAIALAFFLVVTIFGSIITGIGSLFYIFGDKDTGVIKIGKTDTSAETKGYKISNTITKLEIDINAAECEIIIGDEFKVESNLEYLTVKENNNELEIKEKGKFHTNDKISLKIYIPNGTVFKEAEINSGAGTVKIEELSAEELSFEFGAGEVEIQSLTATRKADIEGGAGKVTLANASLKNLDMEIGVGKLNFTGYIFGNSEIVSGIGACDITLLGKKDDYSFRAENGIGKISIGSQKLTDGKILGNGENLIELDNGIGEIDIKFKDWVTY